MAALGAFAMQGLAREPLDTGAACRVLQKAVSDRENLPDTGPPGVGWFCDFAPSKDPALYVIALRSGRPQPYSNLMGWYAVTRATGIISRWDVTKQRAFPLDATKQ
jgi:hypothetical protein